MGGDLYFTAETYAAEVSRKEKENNILDCKDWALAAEEIGGLTAVRGYAVFWGRKPEFNMRGATFTEHWWCEDAAGEVVDSTGIARVAQRLVRLNQQDDVGAVCLAYSGPCSFNPSCPWCTVRKALESQKATRMPLAPIRAVLDSVLREQWRLRAELDDLKSQFVEHLSGRRI